ncbi:hypothetical protein F511_16492 [Dorcoceras hygrometricum]|uniref:Uncharacterized protein n=1 Tax=Dorcoceras hygrometricum TaxID=472368 RepID=A0A2Z7CG37_9LAMI|nr:hypothetical protein F511_16492 [Dorcoceras hygrometricum]
MRIRPPEIETSICDAKYRVSLSTRSVLGKWVYLVTLAMSLFDLQDIRIAIGSLATLDSPMVVDLIGIYGLKGPYFDRSDLIVDRNYDETTVMQMNRMFIGWTGPAPGPMGRFKPITPIHSLEPRVAQYKHHNLKTLASTQKVDRPSPSTTRTAAAHRRAAAVRSSCNRTCFDHSDEVTPSVEKSISLIVQVDWRNRDSGRGPDWRIYRRLQFEVPVSSCNWSEPGA